MNTPAKAAFRFDNFKVTHFSFNEIHDEDVDLTIDISPSGNYFERDGSFEVILDFKAFIDDSKDSPAIKTSLKALFTFSEKVQFDNIPDYFYLNSIAIIYPYLRSFVSNLTLQANVSPLVLPILNLTGLEKPLRENTKIIPG